MEPTTLPEPVGFSGLSKAEQIRYLQALWDRIAERPGEIPVPESHIALAEERLSGDRPDPSPTRPPPEPFDRPARPGRWCSGCSPCPRRAEIQPSGNGEGADRRWISPPEEQGSGQNAAGVRWQRGEARREGRRRPGVAQGERGLDRPRPRP